MAIPVDDEGGRHQARKDWYSHRHRLLKSPMNYMKTNHLQLLNHVNSQEAASWEITMLAPEPA